MTWADCRCLSWEKAMREPVRGIGKFRCHPRLFCIKAITSFFSMNDIGRIIEEQVRKQGRSVSWLAKQLSCHRTNIYDIFRRNNIDIVLLHRLSVLLDYDFFKELSDDVRNEKENEHRSL